MPHFLSVAFKHGKKWVDKNGKMQLGVSGVQLKIPEWAIEKPKLQHARKLTGEYSVDPNDEERKDIIFLKKAKVGDTKGSCTAMQKSALPS